MCIVNLDDDLLIDLTIFVMCIFSPDDIEIIFCAQESLQVVGVWPAFSGSSAFGVVYKHECRCARASGSF